MQNEIKCSKCNGAISEGFVIDHGDYQVKQEQIWVTGAPEASFWSGLKTSNRDAFTVRAFRCAACSYLEFYTTDKVDV